MRSTYIAPAILSALALAACAGVESPTTTLAAGAREVAPGIHRMYGTPLKVGNGRGRAYVELDARDDNAPRELGIALDEAALEGLPTDGTGHHGGHGTVHQYNFALPPNHATPFRFVEVNWNPTGHEPDGVYEGFPHFDFHFWTADSSLRASIVPENPRYVDAANALPTAEYVPASNAVLGPPGAPPSAITVPRMGVHWVDLRSPELQKLLGNDAAWKPFTATFIHGSWDGQFVFWEPMITRAYLLAKKTATDAAVRDEVLPIGMPAKYQVPGYYPQAYRITWDDKAREYRIALTGLVAR